MSKLRAMIVREESLAGFARDCQFDQFIKLGKGKKSLVVAIVTLFLEMLLKPFWVLCFLDKDVARVKEFIYQVMIPKG